MASEPRTTRQRQAITSLLGDRTEFRSAQEIHTELRDLGHAIGLATVYRNLAAMVELGQVDTLLREDGEALYRRCSGRHHHHLVCRSCGTTVEITGPGVERWAAAQATEHGYTEVSHTLELFGLCPNCRPH